MWNYINVCHEFIFVMRGITCFAKQTKNIIDKMIKEVFYSRDHHVLMQDLLQIAIRESLPKNIRQVITCLCIFFNVICRKIIDRNNFDELEIQAIIILCQLEMYFPPSFFDIMVHLIVHLAKKIKICDLFFFCYI